MSRTFLHEQRIGGELEGLDAVRLQPKGAPDAMHGRRRMANLPGHGPQAPVRRTFRERLQRLADRGCDLVVANLARRARSRLVIETIHTGSLQSDCAMRRPSRYSPRPRLRFTCC